jgi:hypothetical protein
MLPVQFADQEIQYSGAFGRFAGLPVQRTGRGVAGSTYYNYPFFSPLIQSAAEAVIRVGASAVGKTIVDVAEQKLPLKQAFRKRKKQAVRRLIRRVLPEIEKESDSEQRGSGRKASVIVVSRRKILPRKVKKKAILKKKFRKNLKKDILGKYHG